MQLSAAMELQDMALMFISPAHFSLPINDFIHRVSSTSAGIITQPLQLSGK